MLVGSMSDLVGLGNWLFVPIEIYRLVLSVIAIKAVHQFEWVRAIASVILPYISHLALNSLLTP